MWNIFLQVIYQGNSIKEEHVFDDDNFFVMITTKVKCKVVKDATKSIKHDKLDYMMMKPKQNITQALSQSKNSRKDLQD